MLKSMIIEIKTFRCSSIGSARIGLNQSNCKFVAICY